MGEETYLVITETRGGGQQLQFLSSIWARTQSHFAQQGTGGPVATTDTSLWVCSFLTRVPVVTGLLDPTSGDDGAHSVQLHVVLGHFDASLFHPFKTLRGLVHRQILLSCSVAHRRATDMDEGQLKGVVHLELLVGIEHLSHIV